MASPHRIAAPTITVQINDSAIAQPLLYSALSSYLSGAAQPDMPQIGAAETGVFPPPSGDCDRGSQKMLLFPIILIDNCIQYVIIGAS